LPFQRLCEVCGALTEVVGALPQFIEQPRVLDGDYSLCGEVRDQSDLLIGEGANLLAVDGYGSDRFVLFKHRHDKEGSCAAKVAERD
jgi:hypothetical protein